VVNDVNKDEEELIEEREEELKCKYKKHEG